jgi:hypothetical protein
VYGCVGVEVEHLFREKGSGVGGDVGRFFSPSPRSPKTRCCHGPGGRTPTKHYFLSNQTPGEGPREVSTTWS